MIDDDVDLMVGKFMEISIGGHHLKRGDDDLTVEHESYQFDVVISVFFP